MVRSTLEPSSPNIQINALATDPKDAIETIFRPVTGGGTDDMPDRPTGNTSPKGTTPYPDVWLRIRRLGNLFTTLYGSTSNSWTVLSEVTVDPAEFPSSVYVGLSTVNHVGESENPTLHTTAVYAVAEQPTRPCPLGHGLFHDRASPSAARDGLQRGAREARSPAVDEVPESLSACRR